MQWITRREDCVNVSIYKLTDNFFLGFTHAVWQTKHYIRTVQFGFGNVRITLSGFTAVSRIARGE
jgi:hypothetical protein